MDKFEQMAQSAQAAQAETVGTHREAELLRIAAKKLAEQNRLEAEARDARTDQLRIDCAEAVVAHGEAMKELGFIAVKYHLTAKEDGEWGSIFEGVSEPIPVAVTELETISGRTVRRNIMANVLTYYKNASHSYYTCISADEAKSLREEPPHTIGVFYGIERRKGDDKRGLISPDFDFSKAQEKSFLGFHVHNTDDLDMQTLIDEAEEYCIKNGDDEVFDHKKPEDMSEVELRKFIDEIQGETSAMRQTLEAIDSGLGAVKPFDYDANKAKDEAKRAELDAKMAQWDLEEEKNDTSDAGDA